jgi:hypothetical protein
VVDPASAPSRRAGDASTHSPARRSPGAICWRRSIRDFRSVARRRLRDAQSLLVQSGVSTPAAVAQGPSRRTQWTAR